MMVSLISAGAVLFSCGEPEDVGPNGGTTNPDKVVADPEGTIILSMRDFDNGNIRIDDKIYINKENWTGEGCSFVSVGEMKGLGNIESIPTTGWANQMGVYPDNGYVAYNRANDAYYRLFVTEYLFNTSEEIIGAKVKYQKPFCGRDEALKTETKDLSFTAEGGTEKVFFKNSSIVPFTVSNSQSWCRVQRISSSDNAFLYDGISVTTLASGLPTMSSDTITLETLYGKKHTIVVQREGHAYLEASAESLDFTAYSGSSTLMLKTNMKWEVYASDSWIELSPTSGDGNAYVKVSVTANDSGKSRTGTVKFVADGKSASVAISQAGGSLSVSPTTLEIVEGGGTKTLRLTTPSTWTATASDTWLKTTPESGSGDATLSVIVEANNSTSTRTGTITFTSVDCTETVVVTQAGGKLSVSTSSLNFGDVGDTKSLKVQASNETLVWTAGTEDAWLKVSPDSGSGSATLIVTAEANNSAANRTGTVTITSGETTIPVTVTQTGGSFSLSASSLSFVDAGESKSLTITTTTSLPWTATSASSWLKVSPESGSGSATLSVTAEANNSTAERTGKINITFGEESIPVTITQTGGSLSVSTSTLNLIDAGETKSLTLNVSNSMLEWKTIVNDPWLNVSPESGSGSATLSISADANSSTSERSGKIAITSGDKTVSVAIIQSGGTLSVSSSSLSFVCEGDTKSLNLQASNSMLEWSTTTTDSWLSISPESGSGNTTIMVKTETNVSTTYRKGKLTIVSGNVSIPIDITQAGGVVTIGPSSLDFSDHGETKSLNLITPFAWTATTSESWIKLSSSSGNGNATLSVTAEANNSTANRTGTITIVSGDKTISVPLTQAGGSLSVSTATLNYIEAGGTKTIKISTSTSLSWTATTKDSWLKISPTSGKGDSSVIITAEANNSLSSRTGTITITSGEITRSVSISQEGVAPIFSVTPSSLSFFSARGKQSLSVTSNQFWTASSSVEWLNLSMTSGTGDATVTVTVQENASIRGRTGVISFVAGDKMYNVGVSQEGATPTFYVTPTSVSFPFSKSTNTLTVTSNQSWTISSSLEWLTFSDTFGTGDAIVTINAETNYSISTRTGTVVFNVGGTSYIVSITQVGAEAIDLGLSSGILWATCNVGALFPEDFGDYYAWGETETKSRYNEKNYKFYNGDNNPPSKYSCYKYKSDGRFILESEDDAASTNWGWNWRMPTDAEWDELIEECSWTLTTQNGVSGCIVVGKNNNSIFLPAAGHSMLDDRIGDGYYWSSSLDISNSNSIYSSGAWYCWVSSKWGAYKECFLRYHGCSVRPVYKP